MYGLVNRGIRDLVIENFDEQVWVAVCAEAGLEQNDFQVMESYDDSVTYNLVGAASQLLETPAEDLLEAFGRHWILYTGAEGWGPLLDSLGSTVVETLGNLNDMHTRIKTTMPSLVMPQFVVRSSTTDAMVVEYHSERDGLAPMVLGLLRGLAERCGEEWEVNLHRLRCNDGFDTYHLRALVNAPEGLVAEPVNS